MALKAILDSIDNVHESLKGEYKKGEDGKFHLDVDGIEHHPAVGALKRAKDREVAESKALRDQFAALTEERDGLLKGAIPKSDVEKLENSYKEKLRKREEELLGSIKQSESVLNNLLVDNVASKIAAELSTAPDLMIPHIRGRLKAEFVEGRGFTRVLDKDGGPSASSLEDFKKEILDNPVFKPILIGSKASGSNSSSSSFKSSSAPTDKRLADMTPAELAAHMEARNNK